MIPLAYLSMIQADQVRGPYLTISGGGPPEPAYIAGVHPLVGDYVLTWDDAVDGSVAYSEKRCKLRLTVEGDRVFGEFLGPVEGRERNAMILGNVDGGHDPVNVLTFRQIEKGYICTYQITLGMGAFMGTWRDTNGAKGDVYLKKVANLPARNP